MSLRERLAPITSRFDAFVARPWVLRLRASAAFEAVANVLRRRGGSYLLYVFISDIAIIVGLLALMDRPEGKFFALLAVVWGLRLFVFLQRAVYDIMRLSTGGRGEARRNQLMSELIAGQFPGNRHDLSPRAYLSAIMRASSAPAAMRAKAEALDRGFTQGLSHDGFVQEWIAARIFRDALDYHRRHQSS